MNRTCQLIATTACAIPLALVAPLTVEAATEPAHVVQYHLAGATLIHRPYRVKHATPAYPINFTANRGATVIYQPAQRLTPNRAYIAAKSISLTTGTSALPSTYLQIQNRHGQVLGWVSSPSKNARHRPLATPQIQQSKKVTVTTQPTVTKLIKQVTNFFLDLGC